jgi:hypothetical protein
MRTKYCICVGSISTPKKPNCANCVVANEIYFGCGQGLVPCGGNTTVDLKTYNPTNPVGTVYAIIKRDEVAFTAASINGSGVLSVTTGEQYNKDLMFGVMYSATYEGKTDLGIVSFCFDNPCETGCTKCNWCDGDCYTSVDYERTVECGETGTISIPTLVADVTACDGTNTYEVKSDSASLGTLTVNGAGLISYGMSTPAAVGDHIIEYDIFCSKYGMTISGTIKLTVEDLCAGVEVDDNEYCDPCTGDIEELESDMSGAASGSASSGSSGTTIEFG